MSKATAAIVPQNKQSVVFLSRCLVSGGPTSTVVVVGSGVQRGQDLRPWLEFLPHPESQLLHLSGGLVRAPPPHRWGSSSPGGMQPLEAPGHSVCRSRPPGVHSVRSCPCSLLPSVSASGQAHVPLCSVGGRHHYRTERNPCMAGGGPCSVL